MTKYSGHLISLFVFTTLIFQSHVAHAILGTPQSQGQRGMVTILVQGDSRVHTGVLVAQDLVLTGKEWFTPNTNPSGVTVTHGVGSGSPQAKPAADVWLHPSLALALLRVPGGFSNGAVFTFDQRATLPNNEPLFCLGFSPQSVLKRAELQVQRSAGNGYVAVSRRQTDIVENDDDGMPCVTQQNGVPTAIITGIALSTNPQNTEHTQIGSPFFKDWIPGMVNLSQVISAGTTGSLRPRPLSLFTIPNPGQPQVRKCLDIPNGDLRDSVTINQYDCHGGANQLWYLDPRADASNPAFVSVNSGKCIDVANGSVSSGVNVQQYHCHGGPNQQWGQSFFNPQGSGLKYAPKQATQANADMCLSVSGGPNNSANGVPVQQAACVNGQTTNNHQRWFIQWK